MRQRYTLSKEQYERIVAASQPVRYMIFGGLAPLSPQDNANIAWRQLGIEMGFDGMTVRPVDDDLMAFTAEPMDPPTDRALDARRERAPLPPESAYHPQVCQGSPVGEGDQGYSYGESR